MLVFHSIQYVQHQRRLTSDFEEKIKGKESEISIKE